MTIMTPSFIGALSTRAKTWDTINWCTVKAHVRRLQSRIAKAVLKRRYNKAKALQWLLTHSFYAKLWAIKRVTQNSGKNTAGIDRVKWRTSKQKIDAVRSLKRRGYHPFPLKRIYIPKRSGKPRPLGIPTMKDRAQQALHLLASEPIADILADKNSYGFRPKRSAHDAIEQCFKALAKKQSGQWILEGDIKSCFDKISHAWLLKQAIVDKQILKKWLKAGYMEKNVFYQTEEGTPQGSVCSPMLANTVLDGLEEKLKRLARQEEKVNYIRYADDFVVTAASKEVLESPVKSTITAFLRERGLELSLEKTKITPIDEGFDFLGFNLRKYKGKLLIKPAKKGVKTFLQEIRKTVRSMRTARVDHLIRKLNQKIQGWTNYYRHSVAKETFRHIDKSIFLSIWNWCKKRHKSKNSSWIRKKYFIQKGQRQWCFYAKTQSGNKKNLLTLTLASDTRIQRHVKIKAGASVYNPDFKEYFRNREKKCGKPGDFSLREA